MLKIGLGSVDTFYSFKELLTGNKMRRIYWKRLESQIETKFNL